MWESPQWEEQEKEKAMQEEEKGEEGEEKREEEKEEEEETPLQKNFVARRNNFPLLCTALSIREALVNQNGCFYRLWKVGCG